MQMCGLMEKVSDLHMYKFQETCPVKLFAEKRHLSNE